MALYYQNLEVWKKAFFLVERVYFFTKGFPKEEQYALIDQMRRAAVSIPSNIAEGSGRGGNPERIHFLHIAKGSAMELHTQILLSEKFGYVTPHDTQELVDLTEEVIKMLYSMVSKQQ